LKLTPELKSNPGCTMIARSRAVESSESVLNYLDVTAAGLRQHPKLTRRSSQSSVQLEWSNSRPVRASINARLCKPQHVRNGNLLGNWRPVRESNPCRRREREAIYRNLKETCGMDSTVRLSKRTLRNRYWTVNGPR
jgi:hypothetical protein